MRLSAEKVGKGAGVTDCTCIEVQRLLHILISIPIMNLCFHLPACRLPHFFQRRAE